MNKVLLLFGVVFLLVSMEPVVAARPSAYARAKAKGRVYVHRPNYKFYKGAKKRHRKSGWFKVPNLTRKAGSSRSRF